MRSPAAHIRLTRNPARSSIRMQKRTGFTVKRIFSLWTKLAWSLHMQMESTRKVDRFSRSACQWSPVLRHFPSPFINATAPQIPPRYFRVTPGDLYLKGQLCCDEEGVLVCPRGIARSRSGKTLIIFVCGEQHGTKIHRLPGISERDELFGRAIRGLRKRVARGGCTARGHGSQSYGLGRIAFAVEVPVSRRHTTSRVTASRVTMA
ncbi:hypothetical protein AWB79_06799 [Caballeronia hypogeia]|uniref:Uncharacterized protein n=1 Tax=Caballeronia hypogeia TaxID=1777140 RepID=A0A158DD27_9BURK|nr:hypothetical protein AWB79_06799 [Caballeronia hypogeia]